MSDEGGQFQGYFDGLQGGKLHGWAWMPSAPDVRVTIELYVEGVLIAVAEASEHRPDLEAAGIGRGCFGFSIPCELDALRDEPVRILIRVQDGPVLTGGEALIGGPLTKQEAAAVEAFVAGVLGQREYGSTDGGVDESAPRQNFFVYCPPEISAYSDGTEYEYRTIMESYIPALARLGVVHIVKMPSEEVDPLYKKQIENGESGVLLSFGSPHRTILGLACPILPVITWAYPTIPSRVRIGDVSHDWRWVFRQSGRAIATSTFSMDAIKAAMGRDFPVVLVPPPVWDRVAAEHIIGQLQDDRPQTVTIDGVLIDTLQGPEGLTATGRSKTAELSPEGVLFSTAISADDATASISDIITAFAAAFNDVDDASLALDLAGRNKSALRREIAEIVERLPAFSCRIIAFDAALGAGLSFGLARSTHWVLNASKAEGSNVRLMKLMAAGIPVISPSHTGLADLVTSECALIISSAQELCSWPHDPYKEEVTACHRISWSSLRDNLLEAYAISKTAPTRYEAMGAAAAKTVRKMSTDDFVVERLASFLGLSPLEDRIVQPIRIP